jgi:hypothetical protein
VAVFDGQLFVAECGADGGEVRSDYVAGLEGTGILPDRRGAMRRVVLSLALT